MNRIASFIAAVGVALSFSATPAQAASTETRSVVHVGDSLSYGAQTQLRRAYRAAGFDEVTIDAVRGRLTVEQLFDASSGMSALARLAPEVHDADVVVIALGTNDAMLPVEMLTQDRINLVLSLIPDTAKVVWVDAYRPGTNAAHWNSLLYANDGIDAVVRWSDYSAKPMFVADGFHLNFRGNRTFAAIIVRAAR